MSSFLAKGRFALGMIIGSLGTVLLLVLIFGVNYCPDAPCHQERSVLSGLEEFLFSFGPNSTSIPHPSDEPDHDQHLSRQDLIAQESMARATNWIVVLSAVSTLFGIVGAVLILWTLLQTRKATQAAVNSNEILREASERELRAYVSVSETKLLYEGDKVRIVMTFRNSGLTPAKEVQFAILARWTRDPINQPPGIPEKGLRSTTTLGHSEEFSVSFIEMGKRPPGISTDPHGIALSCLVTYRDMFGKRRKTLYCGHTSVSLLDRKHDKLILAPRHNRIT